ncbi:acyltransferase family protein [Cohnella xylanilytica]|uniref:acyltransferase family protein n=1 Tax=Cohnella xylanilytica TaxID=557555 RepID=UPI0035DE7069
MDGLRALSVIAVIAYHLNLKGAEGGFLGVGIFFVLSGYLITDQIGMEWRRDGKLNLRRFWIRRMRRLLPAMASMLALSALWLAIMDPTRLQGLKGGILSSLFYVYNWWLLYHRVSYFESFGPPSPIGHLWSLAVEEQFYLAWPILLAIGFKLARYRGRLLLWILAGAAASASAMALIYTPGTDPSRVYYGTDTRAFALLIGAALAVACPSWKWSGKVSSRARGLLDLTGLLGLILLMILIFRTDKQDGWLYRGGFLYLSAISAAVVAVLAHPASRLGKVMGCKPLRWIGVRSYGLYIWHYPVIVLSNPGAKTEGVGFLRVMLQLAVIFLLASLSYRYVEEPARRGRFGVKKTALLLLLMIPIYGAVHLIEPEPEANAPADNAVWAPIEQPKPGQGGGKIQSGEGITAIGDSVLLDAAPFLEERLPGMVVDGKVGRQMNQARGVIDELRERGKLGDRIVIELGTNGPFNAKTLRSLLDSLSDRSVYLVNTRVPKEWQDSVNKTISEVAGEFGNATIIDWYAASEGKDEYFYRDGVHLNPEGAEYYASMLAEALRDTGG